MKPTESAVKTALENTLSGSGWNTGRWTVYATERCIVAESEYHTMNADGYYTRWIPVRVRFPKHRPVTEFSLETPGERNYVRYHGLRDYFEDSVYHAVNPLLDCDELAPNLNP